MGRAGFHRTKREKEYTIFDRLIWLNHKSKATDHENVKKTYLVSKTGTYISANNKYRKKNVIVINLIEMALKIISTELKDVHFIFKLPEKSTGPVNEINPL